MTTINILPAEILHKIFENLDVLNDKGFRLSSLLASHPMLPCSPASGYAFNDLDPSIFEVLAVSRLWRQIGLNTVFRENVADWSHERREMRLQRLRILRIWLRGVGGSVGRTKVLCLRQAQIPSVSICSA